MSGSSPNDPIYVHDSSDSESDYSEDYDAPNLSDVSDDESTPTVPEEPSVDVADKDKDEAVLDEEYPVRFGVYVRVLFSDIDGNEDIEYEDEAIYSSFPGRRSRESWDDYIDRLGKFVISDELLKELPDVEERVKEVRARPDCADFIQEVCYSLKGRRGQLERRKRRRDSDSSSSSDDEDVSPSSSKRSKL